MLRLLIFLFFIITFSITAQAQETQTAVVNLKDGSSVKGVFIGGDAESVTVKTEAAESKIKLTAIKSITLGKCVRLTAKTSKTLNTLSLKSAKNERRY